jgi:FkbM family methyltransferase
MNLIFDIGANQGNFTYELLKTYPTLHAVAIEANPHLIDTLRHQLGNNTNITVLNKVVTATPGEEMPFYVCVTVDTISTVDLDWINNSRFSTEHRYAEPINISTTSLDQLINEYGLPDLIKVDVEGHELAVMKGLTQKVRTICFEWAEEKYEELNQTAKHLQSLGYDKFAFTIGDKYTTDLNYTTWEECMLHSDIDVARKQRWGMVYTI